MNLEQLISGMTPEIYEKLKSAVELGKWADGTALTASQKEHSLQAVIAYQAMHMEQTDHMTVAAGGELNVKSKKVLKTQFSDSPMDDEEDIARFKP
ncbi:YeaC family protein [Echinimonas agarilytica]|uniref:DUF1315 family protein n=1 Tax=Echinimonas agarilytica TaxID=1215918 RepID=A0AA41W8J1_9GAMM|nr:DUF1315 family protein [Echinimonas agarilytica]MCM2680806.1 DUF1315 family protein [Echinimonas agarilytica]